MSEYKKALDYLYNLKAMNPKWSTKPVKDFLNTLNNPEKDFKTIIIGGTNGKGSTSAFLEKVLREAGYKTGLYTSPHLISFKERIQASGKRIGSKDVVELVEFLKPLIQEFKKKDTELSFHEVLVPLAFLYFHKKKIDIAILEVGMGGRLDATNITDPELAIITNIDFDHTKVLGKTLSKIAKEKFAITRPGKALITSSKNKGLKAVQSLAKKNKIELRIAKPAEYKVGLIGEHQQHNAGLVVEACKELNSNGFSISEKAIKKGLQSTTWPGRFEIFDNVILDCAHNPAGLEVFLGTLQRHSKNKEVVIIFGISKSIASGQVDKTKVRDMVKMVKEFGFSKIVLTQAEYRGLDASDLAGYFKGGVEVVNKPSEALARARKLAGATGLVAVTGSIFLVGELRNIAK